MIRRWARLISCVFIDCVFINCVLLTPAAMAMPKWVDSSHNILLPAQVSGPLSATSQFPLFWWNFLVLQLPKDDPWASMDQLCGELHTIGPELVQRVACGENLQDYQEALSDWAKDLPLRQPAVSVAALKAAFAEALSKASLPLGPQMLELLRADPLLTYRSLQTLVESRAGLSLERRHGYFFDKERRWVVVPLQLRFPPERTHEMQAMMLQLQQRLEKFPAVVQRGLVGPQAATLTNEQRIYKDVELISWLGPLLLLLQVLAAIVVGRWRLLLLVPPVLFSTAVATLVTIWIFGSIHGLTLAFGPGIIGLVLDHGLHSCLNTRWKGAWKANWYGLLTTVVALVLMLFSAIPFLRQLMAFSIIGLVFGFATYWFLHRRWTEAFRVQPLNYEPRPNLSKLLLILLLLGGLVIGVVQLRPNFGMQQMNYQTAEMEEVSRWFFVHVPSRNPLLQVYGHAGQSPLRLVERQNQFAEAQHVRLESVADFLPPIEQQKIHLDSWKKICATSWTATEKTFFAPFFTAICSRATVEDLSGKPPAYLHDFYSGQQWLSLWLTKDEAQVALVQAQQPGAQSLRQIVDRFQSILQNETAWMAPLSILLAMLLLGIYYRKLYLVLLSQIPFFVGLGTFALMALIFHWQISFISLIAMVMIFGLSLDYGIFATNLFTGNAGPSGPGVWTSVLFAATATFLGFLPLIFCQHPVLVQLGQCLVAGTAGTIIGSVWGIPCFQRFLARPK